MKELKLPENPFDFSCGLNESAHNGFELAILKFRRIFDEWLPEHDKEVKATQILELEEER